MVQKNVGLKLTSVLEGRYRNISPLWCTSLSQAFSLFCVRDWFERRQSGYEVQTEADSFSAVRFRVGVRNERLG